MGMLTSKSNKVDETIKSKYKCLFYYKLNFDTCDEKNYVITCNFNTFNSTLNLIDVIIPDFSEIDDCISNITVYGDDKILLTIYFKEYLKYRNEPGHILKLHTINNRLYLPLKIETEGNKKIKIVIEYNPLYKEYIDKITLFRNSYQEIND